jgi:hypothetical protein
LHLKILKKAVIDQLVGTRKNVPDRTIATVAWSKNSDQISVK